MKVIGFMLPFFIGVLFCGACVAVALHDRMPSQQVPSPPSNVRAFREDYRSAILEAIHSVGMDFIATNYCPEEETLAATCYSEIRKGLEPDGAVVVLPISGGGMVLYVRKGKP